MNYWNSLRAKWACAVALLLIVTTLTTVFAAEEEVIRPNLTGSVQDESGQPLADATVFVYTAGPRQGAGVLCPSCYADCRKRATTGRDGRFTIESLDPELIFRVLVVAKDRQPEFVANVEPGGKALSVTLKPTTGGETPDRRVRGRVVDAERQPVSGAVVNIRGVTRERGTQFGGNTNIDPVAVSDASGHFVINGREPFQAAGVDVEARGFAKGVFERLSAGEKVHELKLTEGVTIRGRVVNNGKPLPGVEVGVAGADRSADRFVGDFSVATDREGRFLLANVPPRTDYFLYGLMQSLGGKGAIPSRRVRADEDGTTVEIGDLEVKPGFTVEGQIRLTDGKPLPANTQVMLGREEAWDTQRTEADSSGRFRFTGVPPETVSISARVKGYRLSLRNRSLEPLNPFSLMGRINADKKDLIVEFEPGERCDRVDGDSQSVREEPLRGAEAVRTRDGEIQVTGTVVDAETQKPIPAFAVIEGRQTPYNQETEWMSTRRSDHQDGVFTVYLSKQRQAPVIMVEAEGYVPKASGSIGTNGSPSL